MLFVTNTLDFNHRKICRQELKLRFIRIVSIESTIRGEFVAVKQTSNGNCLTFHQRVNGWKFLAILSVSSFQEIGHSMLLHLSPKHRDIQEISGHLQNPQELTQIPVQRIYSRCKQKSPAMYLCSFTWLLSWLGDYYIGASNKSVLFL